MHFDASNQFIIFEYLNQTNASVLARKDSLYNIFRLQYVFTEKQQLILMQLIAIILPLPYSYLNI
jgi:hypothetical protein